MEVDEHDVPKLTRLAPDRHAMGARKHRASSVCARDVDIDLSGYRRALAQ
jgi:hypothetical protein